MKLSEIRDELAVEEQGKAYKWASKREMPGADIAYEWGVKAGVLLGFDASSAIWREKLECAVKALDNVTNDDLLNYKKEIVLMIELKQFLEAERE